MLEFAILVFFVAVYGIVRLLSTVISRSGSWHHPYAQLALLYDGRVESRGRAATPLVCFHHRGAQVRVGLAPQSHAQVAPFPRTRVVIRFRESIPFRLELAPWARQAPAQPPKGTRRVVIEHPSFGHYVVYANDREMARDFLRPLTWASIDRLHELVQEGGMLMSVSPERLLVQLDRDLGVGVELLAGAVQETLSLHDALIAAVDKRSNQGVVIVEGANDGSSRLDPVVCKVCGEPITEGMVMVCETCETPHHRDCWAYVGSCSIYGCQGKKARSERAPATRV